MGYLYLMLGVMFSSVLGITYKLSDRYGCEKPIVNYFLFLTAFVLALIRLLLDSNPASSTFIIGLGIALGLAGFVNVSVFRIAVTKGNISTSWTIANLSLVIPVMASVLFWHEKFTVKHFLGLVLVIVAILLIGKDLKGARK